MASLVVAAVFLVATQVTIQRPQEPGDPSRPVGTRYPEAVDVSLSTIWFNPEGYRDRHVRTRGFLDVLQPGRYHQITEGPARLLLIVPPELLSELDRYAGSEVDARGIVRQLRKKEYTQDGTDVDLIEHPDLPVLPPPSPDLPTYSLTVLGFAEREGRALSRAGAGAPGGSAAALLANPPPRGKKQRVVLRGQFRGRNLFGELPAASRRRPADWVLKDGQTALWVTGKEPRGKGWTLDPDYKGDAMRWLEVSGAAEVVNGVLYLEASRVELVKPPQRAAGEQDP